MFGKVKAFLIIGLFLLVLGGCTVFSDSDAKVTTTPEASVSASVSPSPAPSVSISYLPNSDEIQAYIISGTDFSKQAVIFEIDADLPLEEVIEIYFDTLEDEGFYLRICDAYFKDDGAYIDFDERFYPGSVNRNYEKELLDCIAQTILDNYRDIREVYYLIDGSFYVTDNIDLKDGKCYISK